VVDAEAGDRLALRAAFGDRPDAPLAIEPDGSATGRWLTAVVLGARGRYADASALLDGLRADPSAPESIRAHASVTRAAHLRQLGGHAAARRWDARGLAIATTTGPASRPGTVGEPDGPAGLDLEAARLDALIGLAADAIGIGELETAGRLLHRVERDIVRHVSWRPSVRLSWVRAELALSLGRPDEAVRCAGRAVDRARSQGAVRHEIKSELILLVSDSAAGVAGGEAVNRLDALAQRAAKAGLRTLEWVIFGLLASRTDDLDPDQVAAYRSSGLAILREIRLQSSPDGRSVFDRSPWVPDLDDR
jgi:hypothetical protein